MAGGRHISQAGTQGVIAAIHRCNAALGCLATVFKVQVGCFPVKHAASHGQPQYVLDQRTAGVETGLAGITIVPVFLEGMLQGDRACPLIRDFLGDDVDHTADGIGTIESRHGATNDFDTLNGGKGRNETGGGVAESVRGNVTRWVLATAINKDQGVFTGQAPNADVQAAGFAGALAYIHALYRFECFPQVGKLTLLQALLIDHTDARRRIGNLLLKTGGGDHQLVHLHRLRSGLQ